MVNLKLFSGKTFFYLMPGTRQAGPSVAANFTPTYVDWGEYTYIQTSPKWGPATSRVLVRF